MEMITSSDVDKERASFPVAQSQVDFHDRQHWRKHDPAYESDVKDRSKEESWKERKGISCLFLDSGTSHVSLVLEIFKIFNIFILICQKGIGSVRKWA